MLNMFNTPQENTINKDLCYYIPCTYLPEEGHYYLSEIYDLNNRTAQFYCEPDGTPVESYALRPDHLFPADVRITKGCYVVTFTVRCIPYDERTMYPEIKIANCSLDDLGQRYIQAGLHRYPLSLYPDDEYVCEGHIDRIIDDTLYYVDDEESGMKKYSLKACPELYFNRYSINKAVDSVPECLKPICILVLYHLKDKTPLKNSIYTKEIIMKPFECQ